MCRPVMNPMENAFIMFQPVKWAWCEVNAHHPPPLLSALKGIKDKASHKLPRSWFSLETCFIVVFVSKGKKKIRSACKETFSWLVIKDGSSFCLSVRQSQKIFKSLESDYRKAMKEAGKKKKNNHYPSSWGFWNLTVPIPRISCIQGSHCWWNMSRRYHGSALIHN